MTTRTTPPKRRVVDNNGARRADLAAIHMAKAALGWDDDTYRDIMFTVCRVRSSAQLDFGGRKRFLAHLQACRQQQTGQPAQPVPQRPAWTPERRKIWALWQQLADAGLVQSRSREALFTWVARTTGVDRLEWLNTKQVELCVESLKKWLDRGEPKA